MELSYESLRSPMFYLRLYRKLIRLNYAKKITYVRIIAKPIYIIFDLIIQANNYNRNEAGAHDGNYEGKCKVSCSWNLKLNLFLTVILISKRRIENLFTVTCAVLDLV